MTFCGLDLLDYSLAKTAITYEFMAGTIPEFLTKAIDIKNKHVWCCIINLIEDLKLL